VFAVTDHDTVSGLAGATAAAERQGLACVPGIEVTAVEQERDVHVLGYGFDARSLRLETFLQEQRASRLDRIRQFERRLAALGMPFDAAPLVARAEARGGRAVGRAHVARALVAAGHVGSVDEAFDAWLLPGRPAFVPRRGAPVAEVVACLREAGGLTALAHPALLRNDGLVERLLVDGIDALEAFHSEHDAEATLRYADWSARAGLAVTGGSDFHGVQASRQRRLGGVSLPPDAYRVLRARASHVGTAVAWPDAPD
jgi:predicted metal-dependent phosphoesterase TrpH